MDSWEASAGPGEVAGASDVEARAGCERELGCGPLPPGVSRSLGLRRGNASSHRDPVTRRESGRRVMERSPEVSRETPGLRGGPEGSHARKGRRGDAPVFP